MCNWVYKPSTSTYYYHNFTLDELKKKNENSLECVRCRKPTAVLAQITRYCPSCEYELSGEERPSERKKRLEREKKEKKDRELKKFNDSDAITKKIDIGGSRGVAFKIGDIVQIMTRHLKVGEKVDGICVYQDHISLNGRQSQVTIVSSDGIAVGLSINSIILFHSNWLQKA